MAEDWGQLVKWRVDFRIKGLHKILVERTNLPYLFSPNFKYQLDYLYRTKQIIIRKSSTQEVYLFVPKDLISLEWRKAEGEEEIKVIFSRMSWKSERVLRIIN